MTVVDASVVVDWVTPDSDREGPARLLLRRLAAEDAELSGPPLLLEEASNALLTGVRRSRWDTKAADEAFTRLRQLPIRVHDDRLDLVRAWELSRRHDLHPIYDMMYVALAERLGVRFVTADRRLLSTLSQLDYVVALDS